MRAIGVIWYCLMQSAICAGCYRIADPADDGSGELDTDTQTEGDGDADSDTGPDTDTDSSLSGALQWAKKIDGVTVSGTRSVCALGDGGAVVVGFFNRIAVLGPGEANETELQSQGAEDIALARLAPDGSLVWARQAGGALFDAGYGIVTVNDRIAVMTGEVTDRAVFGPGEPNETVVTIKGSGNFLAKYDLEDGSLVWARAVAGHSGYSIALVEDGSIITSGAFSGSTVFGQGEANETVLTAVDKVDIYLARYDRDGALAWVEQAGGRDHDWSFDLVALEDESVLTVGFFLDEITFGAGEPNQTTLKSAGKKDIFVAKHRADGKLDWVRRIGGRDDDWCESIAALKDGSAMVVGWFYDSTVIAPGEANQVAFVSKGRDDSFLARYHADGRLAWAEQIGDMGEDVGESLSVSGDHWVLITGSHENGALFDSEGTSLAALGRNDAFVAKYRTDGQLAWAKRGGGGGRDAGKSIAVYRDGSSVATGWFQGEAIFGPGEPNEVVLSSDKAWQIFVAKYGP